jgi:four helix bundle protein
MPSSTFKNLRVWRDAIELALQVYASTGGFPKHEIYGLTQQMRRAAVSVPSNIAEGKGHRSDREFVRYLFHARGSLLELQTQILIARRLQYLAEIFEESLEELADSVGRGLNALINSLNKATG